MVSEIGSGGVPPVGLPQSQQGTGNATESQQRGTSASTSSQGIADQVKSQGAIPVTLLPLIDHNLETDGAHQTASTVAEALGGLGLSIANADPSNISGLDS